ncbi:threonine aldolase family protein [Zunongwangia profunda]|uniref:L-threonine aldolase n=2 Tax=Zunongwangia profunda TaxID=398743 RepID=D5BCY2_ZUNPS|nr:GntG family PLP-dependent aldolase [Zunongwangia profunda]ADF52662.1 L-threonine aldolase [Zunongwangia profunda SM-A87]MAS71415.1 threonine aldolase [Zunongwangia sp.]HAJ81600.1 threonine aldolase [Zunongwangia profunda]HCV81423.1 threonine aldolase [Zunongwangia profunda]|tara:strand:+ start:396 stop:1424 length:1029 start_codon:yes stop_codon:yes gene_type:complete
MSEIDLRSDTVTKPTKGMLKAMMNAEVGDDVYKEDPSVNALEEKLAKLFGKDEALFFPTGSMANQAAIKLHTQPADQLICDKWAHVYNYEGGGASFNSGVSCKLVDGHRGMITAKQVEENINPPDFYHSPLTTLVCLENTTNKGGGACYDLEEIKKIRKVCNTHNLGLHLDGARLFNALVAKGESPKEYGKLFDTISVCLSKGLGIPMGSVLIGNKELMKGAMRIRKVLGGGMRQVGFMAAAGIYALDNHIERLDEDHKRAAEIAETLSMQAYIGAVEPVETNIIIFNLKDASAEAEFNKILQKNSIRISALGKGKLRIVTHLDYTEGMHQKFLSVLKNIEL